MEKHLLDLIKTQPYLTANIFYLIWVVVGLFLAVPPKQRPIVITSGLINIPCFPFMVLLENNYWIQKRLGGWGLGFEDAICAFVVAAMTCLVMAMLFRHRIRSEISIHGAFNRYIFLSGISVGLFLIFFSFKLLPMTALILSNFIVWILLLFLRSDLLLFSLSGMTAYAFVHFFLMKTRFLFVPDFILTWNTENI